MGQLYDDTHALGSRGHANPQQTGSPKPSPPIKKKFQFICARTQHNNALLLPHTFRARAPPRESAITSQRAVARPSAHCNASESTESLGDFIRIRNWYYPPPPSPPIPQPAPDIFPSLSLSLCPDVFKQGGGVGGRICSAPPLFCPKIFVFLPLLCPRLSRGRGDSKRPLLVHVKNVHCWCMYETSIDGACKKLPLLVHV